jgi:hypothetical protein
VSSATAPRIGLLRERPLHAELKRWYARPGDRLETEVGGYVIDIVRPDVLIEVQTRGFSSARRKLAALLAAGHRVRIVHPIALVTWIVKVDATGGVLSRRRSPRRGLPCDVFAELVNVADLLGNPRLELDLVLIEVEQQRHHAIDGPWRRRGWKVDEHRLSDVLGTLSLCGPGDLAALLPEGLPAPFTTADLAHLLGRPRRLAQQMAYSLRRAGVVEATDERSRNVAYVVAASRA